MATSSSPDRVRAAQDRALAKYVRREVYPYSAFNRVRLDGCGLGAAGVHGRGDLRRLAPVGLAEVGDGRDAVVRLERDSLISYGRAGLVARAIWAAGWGRHRALLRKHIEPRYRPVQWALAGSVPVGSSAGDLKRLGGLGDAALGLVGLGRGDVAVAVGLAADDLAAVELGLGAVRAGVAWMAVPAAAGDAVATFQPGALVGSRVALSAVLASAALPSLRVVVVTDGPLSDADRARLAAAAGRVPVLVAWSPPGVRSLWVECQPGSGLHTWPGADVLEAGDDGEVLWSPLGWAGTVILRLRTGWRGRIDESPCPACGQALPRVHVDVPASAGRPPAARRRATPLRAPRTAAARASGRR